LAQYKDFNKSQDDCYQQHCRQPHFVTETQSLPCIITWTSN